MKADHVRGSAPWLSGRLLAMAGVVLIAGCSSSNEEPINGRWFSTQQAIDGHELFIANCASCHGTRGEGTADWKKRDAEGRLPPPPLNGTAHAWHHAIDVLDKTIVAGGAPWGGTMPPFSERFDERQRMALIAYIQSLWNDETYSMWSERNMTN